MPSTSIHTVSCRKPISSAPKIIDRCDLTIKCEQADCPGNSSPWTCAKCGDILEYGIDDGNVYCSCGMTKASSCDFNCVEEGTIYTNSKKLNKALEELKAPVTYTILLLGETGVGKSTWINAFVNYLTHPTLKAAIHSQKLITLIPNEFTYTTDNNDCIVIRNGDRCEDEDFTFGQSSTQRCKVHRFKLGSSVIRIIDTPGVADVRGATQDDINFRDVLDTISSFDEIHAIMILLKPNQATLTTTFRYCIQQLFSHLHKSAKNNIVFGFTNCRGTDFRPGDTLPSLKQHLTSRTKNIECKKKNRFCFDSEGYRCVAVSLKGIEMESEILNAYKDSWVRSVAEIGRFFAYIKKIKPHKTKATLSVNNARLLISQLTKPMVEVTRMILQNINKIKEYEERIKKIDDSRRLLYEDLHLEIVTLERELLTHPRTVCAHEDCVTIGNRTIGQSIINYDKWCHEHCYLQDVMTETTNNSALKQCKAMENNKCIVCSHGYEEHMHITYQYNQTTVTVKNEKVREMIDQNLSTLAIKAKAVAECQKLIRELRDELSTVEKIAAKFAVFLERNSITPYNDARIDYLEFQVSELQKMPLHSRDVNLVRQLEQSAIEYEREVDAIKRAEQSHDDSSNIDIFAIGNSIYQLYKLEHCGKILKESGKTAFTESTRTQREVTHTIPSSSNKMLSDLFDRVNRDTPQYIKLITEGYSLIRKGLDLFNYKQTFEVSFNMHARISR